MISHVVVMTPKADLPAADRRAFVDAFERAIREIPSVRAVRIGQRVVHGANYEALPPPDVRYFAMIDFDDLDGLQGYLRHPAHVELGERFYQSLESALVFDFEVSGVDGIRRWGLEH